MKTVQLNILILLLMTSCSINLYRPIATNVVNLDNEENNFFKTMASISDTVMTLRKSDCQINSEDYLIVIYKIKGQTKSLTFTTYGNYPKEAVLENFLWTRIINSLDSINNQKPQPSYYGTIIEGDTTWNLSGSWSGEPVWTFKLYLKTDTTTWETVSSERNENPSMAKTKISDYILAETYNKAFGIEPFYGERKYKKKPIIGK